ncbi:alkaline phosphatase D [Mesonia phycicola]|uniref:Alkaline phosphatase D n=1 Tax=Mesonia phycicola TaxID=579105 RepID=A0A1M6DZZ8_9FLAO|nr:alkaline phosphatase D family protein [Mesonia phycicola]SHI78713.1 alkaline phosphatase D [Mesonia phycicola]
MKKKVSSISRRKFIYNSVLATGGVMLASNFISCSSDDDFVDEKSIPENLENSNFNHGVASFDPTSSQVIIWTRYTTDLSSVVISWQVATDANFENIVRSGEVTTDSSRDYTVAVEVQELTADQKLYYRFIQIDDATVSVTGETITFPENASNVSIAICSCSNYPAGLFNVYESMANSEVDVILHLGDYIYEYGENEYGTNENTSALGRTHNPTNEIISLDDYRTRYKQYRTDEKLQLAHQKKPFICVWDDHEIANDTYIDGAENHQSSEGDFTTRKNVAIQAYSEYVPVTTSDNEKIYRNFNIGNLVNLLMLDTRVIGRDKQLSYADYFTSDGSFDFVSFQTDITDTNRTILGDTQRNWLLEELNNSSTNWNVLGQQVIMGRMLIPMELLLGLNELFAVIAATGSITEEAFTNFNTLMTELVTIKLRINAQDPSLTQEEILRVETVAPYNLDAWDGYAAERELLLNAFEGKKVVCLAGDTHNAWANNLRNNEGEQVAVEFATSSVTSPGFETYLGLGEGGSAVIAGFEQAINVLIDDLQFLNASQRGYVKLNFSTTDVLADYVFIDNITSDSYTEISAHQISYTG